MRLSLSPWLVAVLVIPWVARPATAAEGGIALEDFEDGYQSSRWTFSNGPEFPGARGSFERATEAAHEGRFGGKLTFDFTGGGNYVGALLRMPEPRGERHERMERLAALVEAAGGK